jgi:hypothetical protein
MGRLTRNEPEHDAFTGLDDVGSRLKTSHAQVR